MNNFQEKEKPDFDPNRKSSTGDANHQGNANKSGDVAASGPQDSEKGKNFTSTDSAYLEKLEFRPELRKTWLNFFVTRFRVVALLVVVISAWGLYSFFRLPRESNPEVKIPIAVITDAYPGASPSDVEELVTKKIETDISGVAGVDKITSNSTNSFSSVTVEFDSNQNLTDAIRSLRDQLPNIRRDIPDDAQDPQVIEISFDDTPIVTFALVGPYNGFEMRGYAETIQDELEKIPGIRQVDVDGGDQNEFDIAYDPQKLTFYGISVDQANQAVAATNHAIPAGNFKGKEFDYPVRADARFFDAVALGNVPVLHADSGAIVYLKDIASVQETAIEKTVLSRFSIEGGQPQSAVTIQVVKRAGGNILDTVNQANQTIETLLKTFPPGIEYQSTLDMADEINKDFTQLQHDFFLTLALVMIILFLIVGLKEALVAGLAIPLVFFITFGVMQMTGTSLNFLSIFSLLLSLGLLVDDAIVVVSATKQYMKTGKYTPEEAVLLVLHDFKIVLTTTTLATVWAFLPLLLSTGIIGEFIKSIPITVSVTLVASLFVALMINHPLAAILERIRFTKRFYIIIVFLLLAAGSFGALQHNIPGYGISAVAFFIIAWMFAWYFGSGKNILNQNKLLMEREWDSDELIKEKLRKQGIREEASLGGKIIHGIVHFDRVLPVYEKYLRKIMGTRKRRIATIAATTVLFLAAVALPIFGIVKSEFFPPQNSDTLFISVEGPPGLDLSETNLIAEKIDERLLGYPEIVNFSTIVGNPGSQGEGISVSQNTSNTASFTIKLTDTSKRSITSYDLAQKMRSDFADIQGATISVSAPSGGPPSGSAFQAQISGDDLQTLDKIARDLKPILDSIPGTVNSDISLKNSPAEYTFHLDPARMELYGLNAALVGNTLRTAISGTTVTNVISGNKTIDVVAKFENKKIPSLDAIQNLEILNTSRQPVYIKDVAEIQLVPSVDTITRINQKRTVLLTAGVSGKTSSTQVVKEFQDNAAREYKLPAGYSITYGGENEQNTESVLSIIRAMAIAAALIIVTLVIQFDSFIEAMIVLVTLPLALIGVFIGMAIFGVNLSFPGLIGILALFGIVVKNAIILIDKINLNIRFGIPFEEAAIDAGKSRLEAIFITSFCTIAGIIPITLSNELWRSLGSAIIFGLSISSFFTLFVVPTLYVSLVKTKKKPQK
ncbi:MAG: efflux RND transporter permease subunit [Parcubacteria group bacterium]|jgi:HAE1 family hydrophobic/amphiphilic exporter-1